MKNWHFGVQTWKWDSIRAWASNIDFTVFMQEQILTLYLIERPFNAFANRADPDQLELQDEGQLCLIKWKYDISDPTLADLTSNFFVLCTNMKVYLYNYQCFCKTRIFGGHS